eukprot:5105771-Prymnesium_polylepis.2
MACHPTICVCNIPFPEMPFEHCGEGTRSFHKAWRGCGASLCGASGSATKPHYCGIEVGVTCSYG